jgi:hypothetical protein
MNEKRILLWLDDYRDPFRKDENGTVIDVSDRVKHHTANNYTDIHWVRSYDEFIHYLMENNMPYAVSFDHDLEEEHYAPSDVWDDYPSSVQWQEENEPSFTEKTGHDCAKWLKAYCNKTSTPLPRWTVHSANPVGSQNIIYTLLED